MSKLIRHNRILELVSEAPISNQDELRRRLVKAGIEVTQATLSRDIKELGLVKTARGYAVPGADLVHAVVDPMVDGYFGLSRATSLREIRHSLLTRRELGR